MPAVITSSMGEGMAFDEARISIDDASDCTPCIYGNLLATHCIPHEFDVIADKIRKYVQRDPSFIPDCSQSIKMKEFFSDPNRGALEYDVYAKYFAYEYLERNYWKYVATFIDESPILATNVVDLGAGSGAFGLAYIAWLEANAPTGPWPLELTLVDLSSGQLELASRIIEFLQPELGRVNLTVNTIRQDIRYLQSCSLEAELVLSGHVITENQSSLCQLMTAIESSVRPGGQVYVVERHDDPLWARIETTASNFAWPALSGPIAVTMRCLRQPGASRQTCTTKYLAAQFSTYQAFPALIRRYFEAWTEQSVQMLSEVFDEEATYVEHPYRPVIRGIDAIELYWRQKVLVQQSPSTKILSTFVKGAECFVEWQASFGSLDGTKTEVAGAMRLRLNLSRDRLASLTEYFRTSRSQNGSIPQ